MHPSDASATLWAHDRIGLLTALASAGPAKLPLVDTGRAGDDRRIVSLEPQDNPTAPRAAAPRKAAPRGQQAVDALRSAIVAGRYKPGERLIETSLSEGLVLAAVRSARRSGSSRTRAS